MSILISVSGLILIIHSARGAGVSFRERAVTMIDYREIMFREAKYFTIFI